MYCRSMMRSKTWQVWWSEWDLTIELARTDDHSLQEEPTTSLLHHLHRRHLPKRPTPPRASILLRLAIFRICSCALLVRDSSQSISAPSSAIWHVDYVDIVDIVDIVDPGVYFCPSGAWSAYIPLLPPTIRLFSQEILKTQEVEGKLSNV